MAVITISRQYGAGGRTLGRMVAQKLGYTFADSEIIERLAREARVSPQWVESFEKEAGTRLSRFISSMVAKKWVDRVLKEERGYLDEQSYLDYLVLIIAQVADEGNVVILGRGSQYILDDHPDAYHVLLVDRVANRIKFLMDRQGHSEAKAAALVESEDRRRALLYGRLGKSDFDAPLLYHLVIHMGRLGLDRACDLVCRLVGEC
ncbi:MAG: cytidylate kinase-like family protein [Desulfobacterales bacterium]|jgi:cytidylate kinase|nr:cytidylate kinase-like family protein [Desulfobacteraceae bacterium]MDY0310525.1 cytidylate kinase-like family protein [Desulfobacterales bacterium]